MNKVLEKFLYEICFICKNVFILILAIKAAKAEMQQACS